MQPPQKAINEQTIVDEMLQDLDIDKIFADYK